MAAQMDDLTGNRQKVALVPQTEGAQQFAGKGEFDCWGNSSLKAEGKSGGMLF